jgi:hypothetical protein
VGDFFNSLFSLPSPLFWKVILEGVECRRNLMEMERAILVIKGKNGEGKKGR